MIVISRGKPNVTTKQTHVHCNNKKDRNASFGAIKTTLSITACDEKLISIHC